MSAWKVRDMNRDMDTDMRTERHQQRVNKMSSLNKWLIINGLSTQPTSLLATLALLPPCTSLPYSRSPCSPTLSQPKSTGNSHQISPVSDRLCPPVHLYLSLEWCGHAGGWWLGLPLVPLGWWWSLSWCLLAWWVVLSGIGWTKRVRRVGELKGLGIDAQEWRDTPRYLGGHGGGLTTA